MSTSGRKTGKSAPEQLADGNMADVELTSATDPDVSPAATEGKPTGGDTTASASGERTGEPTDETEQAAPAPMVPGNRQRDNSGKVEVFPQRTYHDGGELRRRGGKGYVASKRHADALVLRGLASFEGPEE